MSQAPTTIVVKDASNADVTFTLISPAAGDGGTAVYKNKSGDDPRYFATLLVTSRSTKSGRASQIRLTRPRSPLPGDNGGPVAEKFYKTEVVAPDLIPESQRDDDAVLWKNLQANASIQAVLRDGVGLN